MDAVGAGRVERRRPLRHGLALHGGHDQIHGVLEPAHDVHDLLLRLLYIADPHNHRILGFRDARKAQSGDIADLVIGQPDFYRALCNYPTANPDTPNESGLCYPVGLALDSDGNLYVADAGNSRIVRFPKPFSIK